MKDIPRNEEEDGRRIRVFKEEMTRRAEETRSYMMTNSTTGGGNFRMLSPTGSGHQSAINIKIERENGTENGEGNEYEIGKENYFKVNIENGSGQKNELNSKRESSDYVEKEIFLDPKYDMKRNFMNSTSEQEKIYNVKGNPTFNVNIENGVKINIEKSFETRSNGSNTNQEKFSYMPGQNSYNIHTANGGTISESNGTLEERELVVQKKNDLNNQNGFLSKNLPASYLQNGGNTAKSYQSSGLDVQGEHMAPGNQNSNGKTSSGKNTGLDPKTVYSTEFASYGPRNGSLGSEECKCADREAEKAQLRELNDRHLLLLSEKQGVINCLLQKIETLTKLREVFVDEDRDKLKNTIEFLEKKIKDSEKQNEESSKEDVIKDGKIDDLEKKIKDLESELLKNEEDVKAMEDLKKENAILTSAKKADDEKMEWIANERDHDRENFDNFAKKVFTEKWEEILEKVEKGCDGKSYLENVEKKLEELRNAFDDRSAFDDMEAKYKEQIAALHENLESERENTANTAGDNSEMKCKMEMFEEQLEALKRENEEAKEKLADEKIVNARELAEKDAAAAHLNNLLPNLSRYGVGQSNGSGCINNIPVDLAQELGVYKKILDAVGEEKEKERVEEVCKRIVHSKETTTTYHPGQRMENGHNGDIL